MNVGLELAEQVRAAAEKVRTEKLAGEIQEAILDGAELGAKWQRDQLRTDEAVERVADGLYQHDGSDRRLIDHENDCVWEQCTMPDSYRREARAVITALLGEES